MFTVDYTADPDTEVITTETFRDARDAERRARYVSRKNNILVYVFQSRDPKCQRVFYGGRIDSTDDGYLSDKGMNEIDLKWQH